MAKARQVDAGQLVRGQRDASILPGYLGTRQVSDRIPRTDASRAMVHSLYQVLQRRLLTFEQQWTDEAGRTLPRFVTEELHSFLDCGCLTPTTVRLPRAVRPSQCLQLARGYQSRCERLARPTGPLGPPMRQRHPKGAPIAYAQCVASGL